MCECASQSVVVVYWANFFRLKCGQKIIFICQIWVKYEVFQHFIASAAVSGTEMNITILCLL